MKNILLLYITFLFISTHVNAKTIYITDEAKYTLRQDGNTNSKIIKMLTSGTELTVLSKDKNTGYSRVRTSNGEVGYVLTSDTLNKPINKWFLSQANKSLESLKQEKILLEKEVIQLKSQGNLEEGTSNPLIQENEKIKKELAEIRRTAANAVQTRRQRDHIQGRFISVERQLQQIKRENQTLKDSSNQDWFLYGGFLSLLGVILGIILPKLSWQRKRSSSWDTF
ncbi:MAG: TIGR04211 family SH3 domain-containing protein [Methylococcales bacterium]|nr:TIGR04211 family SH3 domain-containing protein [Methylococcales bacterium]